MGAVGTIMSNYCKAFGMNVVCYDPYKSVHDSKIKQYDNLGDEEMVTLERGSAIFDKGESVVRTANFGKLNDTLLRVEGILSNQKLSVNTETHHGTRYR